LFGELMEDQNRRYLAPGLPLVSVLSNRHKDSKGNQAKVAKNATWHTDHTNQEFPPKFTTLYPVELPDSGGGTSVCNMRDAYEALPEDLRQRITNMKTANTLISSARAEIGNPDTSRTGKADVTVGVAVGTAYRFKVLGTVFDFRRAGSGCHDFKARFPGQAFVTISIAIATANRGVNFRAAAL